MLDVGLLTLVLLTFYAVLGMQLFGIRNIYSLNDDNFTAFSPSFLALYVLTTTENFPTVMYAPLPLTGAWCTAAPGLCRCSLTQAAPTGTRPCKPSPIERSYSSCPSWRSFCGSLCPFSSPWSTTTTRFGQGLCPWLHAPHSHHAACVCVSLCVWGE